jgi:glycosyltransferase involved in cell wall biosynthesis
MRKHLTIWFLALVAVVVATDARAQGPLTPAGYKVAWISHTIPATMAAGRDETARVTFRNASAEAWPLFSVRASYHWWQRGKMLPGSYGDEVQSIIPAAVLAGAEASANLLILPPDTPGSYELQLTMVGPEAWFENRGAATLMVPVTVTAGVTAAAPVLPGDTARALSAGLWIVLAIALLGAGLAARGGHTRLVRPLASAAATAAVLVAIIPVVSAPLPHLATQPYPDAHVYADAARHLARGDGYLTTAYVSADNAEIGMKGAGDDWLVRGPARPPMFPPGLSLALAPAAAVGDFPANVQMAARFFAILYIVIAAVAAWSLAGPVAAALASILLALSPFARVAAQYVISDAFAVVLVVLILMLVRRVTWTRAWAGGLVAGALVAVRLNMLVALIALLFAVPARYWRAVIAGAAPALGALAVYQWLTFGNPFTTGYQQAGVGLNALAWAHVFVDPPAFGDFGWLFPDRLNGQLMAWVCPCPGDRPVAALSNLSFYPTVMSGLFWVFTPPLVTLAGLVYAWRHRTEPAARFTLIFTVLTLLMFTFYYYQSARFVAAPATLLGIYAAVAVASARRSAVRAARHESPAERAIAYEPRYRAEPDVWPAVEAWPAAALAADSRRDARFRLSVIVPVYNERYVVEASLRRLLAIDSELIGSIEVIVVDDASTDGTREVLERVADVDQRVLLLRHERNRGKGGAIRTGIEHATGDITLIHDADLEYFPEDIPSLLVPFRHEGADAVFGSRYLSAPYRRALMHRHTLVNRALTFISNWFTDLNLTDLETCYKAVNTTLLKSIPLRSDDFRIEVELTFKLAKRRARIFEVPIRYTPRTQQEGKKIRPYDGVLAIRAMVHFALIDDLYRRDEYGSHILVSLERARRFNAWMAERLRPHVGTRVLEIGAGIGSLTSQFIPRGLYVASDINPHYLRYLQSYAFGKPYLRVLPVDVTQSGDFAALGGTFDTVIMLNVLEHVPDEAAALRNLWSALQPGGRAIILVPHHPALFGTLDTALAHRERYSRARLQQSLHAAGFHVEHLFDFNRVSVPGWWLSGKVLRRRTFSRVQLKLLECLMPVLKRIDHLWPWTGLSLVGVAVKPERKGETGKAVELAGHVAPDGVFASTSRVFPSPSRPVPPSRDGMEDRPGATADRQCR